MLRLLDSELRETGPEVTFRCSLDSRQNISLAVPCTGHPRAGEGRVGGLLSAAMEKEEEEEEGEVKEM